MKVKVKTIQKGQSSYWLFHGLKRSNERKGILGKCENYPNRAGRLEGYHEAPRA